MTPKNDQPAIPTESAHKAQPTERDERADSLRAQVEPDRLPPGNWPGLGTVPVSVLIPVKNEQANIVECLRHARWAQYAAVVDSQSTDETIALAQAMGADVFQFHHSKEGWPKKKNWALEHVAWPTQWVLIMDADEHMTPELAEEVREVVTGEYPAGNGCGDGYWLNRKFIFMGKWIKRCGYYPSWNVRLFKHALGRYERIGSLGDTGSGDNEVHEHVVLSTGQAGYLKNDFLHYAYPDITTWVEKHNRYSTWEAHSMAADDEGGIAPSLLGGPIARRRWLKAKSRGMPFRATLRFFYAYILKGGFLDGYAGFVFCRLLSIYEFLSVAKSYELRHRNEWQQGGPP